MLTIGITGGIGSGKSMVAKLLEKRGAAVILADEIAKEVVEPGTSAYKSIVQWFGDGILDKAGRIDRKKLGEIVFSNREQLEMLNRFTHSAVADRIEEILDGFKKQQVQLAVVEAIVPVRHGFLDLVDTVWVVVASEDIRIKRIKERSGLTPDEARQRIRAQMSDEMYKSIARQVIYNEGTVQELEQKVQDALQYEIDSRS